MQNLRDKLLKAGLVSEDQAKKAEAPRPSGQRHEPSTARREASPRREAGPRREEGSGREQTGPRREGRRPEGNRPQGRPGPTALAPNRPVPKLPPLPGSKAHQRLESKRQVELDRRLRELVYAAQVPIDIGASVFYFMTRKGKLRRLELTEPQAQQLQDGVLAVVERPEPAQIEHSLVPAAVAEQMHALSPKAVRFLNRKEAPIGFMSDEQLKARQAAEAAGEEPEEAEAEAEAEAAGLEAEAAEPEAEAQAAEAPAEGQEPSTP